MFDYSNYLTRLRRPKLLIRAARAGALDYRRDRDLKRIYHDAFKLTPNNLIATLLKIEELLELERTNGEVQYSIGKHIEVLCALMVEANSCTPSAAPELKQVA